MRKCFIPEASPTHKSFYHEKASKFSLDFLALSPVIENHLVLVVWLLKTFFSFLLFAINIFYEKINNLSLASYLVVMCSRSAKVSEREFFSGIIPHKKIFFEKNTLVIVVVKTTGKGVKNRSHNDFVFAYLLHILFLVW